SNPPGSGAPPDTDFTNLANVRAHATRIAARVNARSMPPNFASTQPTDAERTILANWATDGAPGQECTTGNPKSPQYCLTHAAECCVTDPSWCQDSKQLPCTP